MGGSRLAGLLTGLLTGLLALGVLVGAAPAAQAHDRLASTTPADGSTVSASPGAVVLTFDQPALAVGTRLLVLGPGGQQVSAGAPRLVDDTVTQDLGGALPAGRYTVQWRVTSADGHPVSGVFTYTSTGAGKGAEASAGTGGAAGADASAASGRTGGAVAGAAPSGPTGSSEQAAQQAGAPAVTGPAATSSSVWLVLGVLTAVVVVAAVLVWLVLVRRRRTRS